MRARKLWGTVGHQFVTRVIKKNEITTFRDPLLRVLPQKHDVPSNVPDAALSRCPLHFLTNIYTHARSLTFIFIVEPVNRVRFRGVVYTGQFGISALSVFPQNGGNLTEWFPVVSERRKPSTPNLSNVPVTARILKLLYSVIGWSLSTKEIWPFMYRGMRADLPARTLRNATFPTAPFNALTLS